MFLTPASVLRVPTLPSNQQAPSFFFSFSLKGAICMLSLCHTPQHLYLRAESFYTGLESRTVQSQPRRPLLVLVPEARGRPFWVLWDCSNVRGSLAPGHRADSGGNSPSVPVKEAYLLVGELQPEGWASALAANPEPTGALRGGRACTFPLPRYSPSLCPRNELIRFSGALIFVAVTPGHLQIA